jgi:hypothetical protein
MAHGKVWISRVERTTTLRRALRTAIVNILEQSVGPTNGTILEVSEVKKGTKKGGKKGGCK